MHLSKFIAFNLQGYGNAALSNATSIALDGSGKFGKNWTS